MSLIVIALFNSLLGVVCGLWFRVLILIPLVVFAFIEVVLLKESGMGLSPFRAAIALVVLLEIGYLIGASIARGRIQFVEDCRHNYLAGLLRNVDSGGGEWQALHKASDPISSRSSCRAGRIPPQSFWLCK